MSTIDDLEVKAQRLRHQLSVVEDSLLRAKIAAAPVKVGDVVTNRKGEEFRVVEVIPRYSWLEVMGNPRKKNGEWSKGVRRVYGWDEL